MDEGPVSRSAGQRAVELEAEAAARPADPGMVVSGFRRCRTGTAPCFSNWAPEGLRWPAAAPWLTALQQGGADHQCRPPERARRSPAAAAIAFTWTGLARMGLRETALASFARPFCEGMFQEDRSAGWATGATATGLKRS